MTQHRLLLLLSLAAPACADRLHMAPGAGDAYIAAFSRQIHTDASRGPRTVHAADAKAILHGFTQSKNDSSSGGPASAAMLK
jgi:hypothetical protein